VDRIEDSFEMMHRNLLDAAHYCFPLLGTVWMIGGLIGPGSAGSKFGKTGSVSTNDISAGINDF
jgi:hypothetical protein